MISSSSLDPNQFGSLQLLIILVIRLIQVDDQDYLKFPLQPSSLCHKLDFPKAWWTCLSLLLSLLCLPSHSRHFNLRLFDLFRILGVGFGRLASSWIWLDSGVRKNVILLSCIVGILMWSTFWHPKLVYEPHSIHSMHRHPFAFSGPSHITLSSSVAIDFFLLSSWRLQCRSSPGSSSCWVEQCENRHMDTFRR